ncbi:uncharacterized protein LOC144160051 [Haemaphysalis longicornis]
MPDEKSKHSKAPTGKSSKHAHRQQDAQPTKASKRHATKASLRKMSLAKLHRGSHASATTVAETHPEAGHAGPSSGVAIGATATTSAGPAVATHSGHQFEPINLDLPPPRRVRSRRKMKHTFAKRCTEISVVVVAIMVLLGLAFFVAGRFLGKRTPALLVCTTEVCSKYADMFDNNINDDVEPCDNFYRHVCAPQVRKQAKATFETLRDNHFIKVWEYLAGVEVPDKGGSALEKAARYLQSCHSVLNVTDTQEVKDVLRKGGITWPDPASHSLDFLDGIFYMSARVFKPVFFSVTVRLYS